MLKTKQFISHFVEIRIHTLLISSSIICGLQIGREETKKKKKEKPVTQFGGTESGINCIIKRFFISCEKRAPTHRFTEKKKRKNNMEFVIINDHIQYTNI